MQIKRLRKSILTESRNHALKLSQENTFYSKILNLIEL